MHCRKQMSARSRSAEHGSRQGGLFHQWLKHLEKAFTDCPSWFTVVSKRRISVEVDPYLPPWHPLCTWDELT
jgi:hypothetical protein